MHIYAYIHRYTSNTYIESKVQHTVRRESLVVLGDNAVEGSGNCGYSKLVPQPRPGHPQTLSLSFSPKLAFLNSTCYIYSSFSGLHISYHQVSP